MLFSRLFQRLGPALGAARRLHGGRPFSRPLAAPVALRARPGKTPWALAAGLGAAALTTSSVVSAEEDIPLVTMNELIGPMDHLRCIAGTLKVRGLDVAYWRYENPKFDGLDRPPVIALHGGPASTHHSQLPLMKLADMGYPVIFYDQGGCGASSYQQDPAKDAPWLLTVDYYVEELYALLHHLQLFSGYYVYGNSWGSMLAQEFAVTQPKGLRGLVLAGALCDSQVYIKTQWRDRISTLPTYTQRLLRKLEDAQAYDHPAYAELDRVLTKHFVHRLVPKAQCMRDAGQGANQKIYTAMQGQSEFTIGGVLEHWCITERLQDLRVPSLVMMGEWDTMTKECHQLVVDSIPTAWPLVIIPRAGHCKIVDEPLLCCEAMRKFIFTVEETRVAGKREAKTA